MQNIAIFGATGSIGDSTLDVIGKHAGRFSVYALSAYSRIQKLLALSLVHHPKVVIVPDEAAEKTFRERWPANMAMPEIRVGSKGLCETARDAEVDTVVAAIVGTAGLPSAFAAAQAGKRILLANKEALVAAGSLFMETVKKNNATLLPLDSEHNAIFQCLPGGQNNSQVKRLVLTASGGPFRNTDPSLLSAVTPEQACKHPNWSMGRKISIDSATMLNKGLEVIEAKWMFDVDASKIDVLVHPESTIHSMVEYIDGSLLAQLGNPDMRIPISYALGYPDRIENNTENFDLSRLLQLNFELPDYQRFPCLKLAFDALKSSQSDCVVLNASNEIAVDYFLKNKIKFTDIAVTIEKMLDGFAGTVKGSLAHIDDVFELDALTRSHTSELLNNTH
ncbi:MAG: 1-deoxy-D-xylulose-5-phosphate reductoisomerase [Advenella sp.]|nr:1-deoxy-D-xylulose-5-phosphate reductoisomerase [Advenella sp.]